VGSPKFGKFLSAIIGFLLGSALCFFASVIRTFFPPLGAVDRAEEQRVTSPDGKFDAILVREGLRGETTQNESSWYLYAVEKAQSGPFEEKYSLLRTNALRGAKLEWEGPRVVLFEYNHAEIQNFRNFWNVVDPPTLDPSGKAEDFIEIRLVARPGDS